VLDSRDQQWRLDGRSSQDRLPQNARASELITFQGTGIAVFISDSQTSRTQPQ
jgi:hypothetical protein